MRYFSNNNSNQCQTWQNCSQLAYLCCDQVLKLSLRLVRVGNKNHVIAENIETALQHTDFFFK